MANFIEELYYSNIDVHENRNDFTEKAKTKLKDLIEKEENIKKTLSEDAEKMFTEFADLYSDYVYLSNLEKFIIGFRVGAKFTYDTFKSDN